MLEFHKYGPTQKDLTLIEEEIGPERDDSSIEIKAKRMSYISDTNANFIK